MTNAMSSIIACSTPNTMSYKKPWKQRQLQKALDGLIWFNFKRDCGEKHHQWGNDMQSF